MKRAILAFIILLSLGLIGATWSKWNNVTVGSTAGNVGKYNNLTIGTTAGNCGAWNGLVSPSGGPSCGTTAATLPDVTGDNVDIRNSASPATSGQIGNTAAAGDAYFAWGEALTGTALAVSDACGASTNYDTFTNLASNVDDGLGGVWSAWVAYNVKACNSSGSGVTLTITATGGGNVYGGITHMVNIANPGFDQGPATASGLTSGSVTTLCAKELALGLVIGGDGGTTPTAGTGWTLARATNSGSRNPGWEYKTLSATGSNSATFAAGSGTVHTSIFTFYTSP